jgi:DnaJ-class molecular chaperone
MTKVQEPCPECDGSGEVEVEYVRGYGPNADLAYRLAVCEECGGRGTVAVEDGDEDGDE